MPRFISVAAKRGNTFGRVGGARVAFAPKCEPTSNYRRRQAIIRSRPELGVPSLKPRNNYCSVQQPRQSSPPGRGRFIVPNPAARGQRIRNDRGLTPRPGAAQHRPTDRRSAGDGDGGDIRPGHLDAVPARRPAARAPFTGRPSPRRRILWLYPDSMRTREKCLAFGGGSDSDGRMIRGGFLIEEDRKALIALARDGLAAGRVTRRANALVLLDKGMSCQQVAEVLLFDDDTIRGWYELFEQSGVEGLSHFDVGGSSSKMTPLQCGALKGWVGATLPRSTRHIGAWIAKEFGLVYESRSGLIALLHRLGLEYHKPEVISRKLDPKTQKAFIASYEDLLNSKGDDEVAIFVDAVHPTHAARPVGCWAPKEQKLAIEQTSGRERINIHGAIDLETGQTRMIEAETIDAISTIRLLEWLARPSCRIKLHFLPTYCPHLNPIERLWGVMHKNITHNKCYGTCGEFAETTLEFLRDEVPRRWAEFCDSVTDNFRIISPKDFRLLG